MPTSPNKQQQHVAELPRNVFSHHSIGSPHAGGATATSSHNNNNKQAGANNSSVSNRSSRTTSPSHEETAVGISINNGDSEDAMNNNINNATTTTVVFDRDDDSLTNQTRDDDVSVTATNLSTAPPVVRYGVNTAPGAAGRNSGSQQMLFGPNRSAVSMLKALRFSPFVATNTRRNNASSAGNNNNNNDDDDDNDTPRSNDFYREGDPGRVPTSAWEFFTPSMTKYYAIIGYIFAIIMFSCSIASIVARYKTKPNHPIECDYRLDQALSWLAGLMMPEAIFVPIWVAIFLQHVYPPLYQASRVPLERTFRHYGHFVAFSSFLAIFTVGIFGSSLYALSVAKSWDFVEHEACGYSFSMLRSIAIIGISSIGFIAVAHFIHWAYLNKKLDNVRGIVRPIPGEGN